MRLPLHNNPSPDRTASAPYSFAPLPEVVVNAVEHAENLSDRDRFHPNCKAGYFEVELKAK